MKILLCIAVFVLMGYIPPREKATVYIFLSAKCPCIYSHQETVSWLEKKYGPRVKFNAVFIDQTDDRQDMEMTMKNLSWKMKYFKDGGKKFVRRFHPKMYTDCFLVSPLGVVLYQGAIDDSPLHMGQVQNPYLEEAIDGYLKNGIVKVRQVKGVGCLIAGN